MMPLLVSLAVIVAFLLGAMIYVAGSYLFMLSHAEPRPWRQLSREALAELRWTLRTQPLLPLYYLLGDKLGAGVGKTPVVFVHGYAQNRVGFIGLAKALRKQGFGPLYGFNYPWFRSIASNGARLGRFVEEVRRKTGAEQVDLVCHSMGGLVALEYVRQHGKGVPVRACVTIATPHAGVAWRGPIPGQCGPEMRSTGSYLKAFTNEGLAIKVLSIFSSHDNVVYPYTTSQLATRGGVDLRLDGGGHMALLFNKQVIDHVARFLKEADSTPALLGKPEVEQLRVVPTRDEAPISAGHLDDEERRATSG